MANRNWANKGNLFAMHAKPVLVTCSFIVDSTNGNGLGIRSLKGPAVANVFMNTSASFTGTTHTGTAVIDSISGGTSSLTVGMPIQTTDLPLGATIASITSSSAIVSSVAATTGHAGATITYQGVGVGSVANPNPAAGFVLIQLSDNYTNYLGGFSGFVSPIVSPTTAITSGLTIGQAYVVTVQGTTTATEWASIGVPASEMAGAPNGSPPVGLAFIATATGTGGSHTGKVGLPSVSATSTIEVVGDPNQSIAPINTPGVGANLIVQCLAPTISTGAYITPYIPTAPANGSVMGMAFLMSDSSVPMGINSGT